MNNGVKWVPGVWALLSLAVGSVFLASEPKPLGGHRAPISPSPEKLIQYIRDRFGVPSGTKMTLGPFRSSLDPEFEEATIAIQDGSQKKDQNILVSKDGHYLIVGTTHSLNADQKDEVARYVRQEFKLPETVPVDVGAPRKSSYASLNEISVTVEQGGKKQSQNFYLFNDNHALILGSVFDLSVDPVRQALRVITTRNQPSEGPANAPVTMVEYADLQCPTCARLQEFLQTDLVPKYGDKLRVIFKEFPLPMHDWSHEAAIATQCAYQIKPDAFVTYRSLIFKNQTLINVTNARDMLLSLAAQAGIDSLKLGGCLDSKATLPRVEQNVKEGKDLGVNSTPTSYVNGRMIVGTASPQVFYDTIEAALHNKK